MKENFFSMQLLFLCTWYQVTIITISLFFSWITSYGPKICICIWVYPKSQKTFQKEILFSKSQLAAKPACSESDLQQSRLSTANSYRKRLVAKFQTQTKRILDGQPTIFLQYIIETTIKKFLSLRYPPDSIRDCRQNSFVHLPTFCR